MSREPLQLSINDLGTVIFLTTGRTVVALETAEAEAIAVGILQLLSNQKKPKNNLIPFAAPKRRATKRRK